MNDLLKLRTEIVQRTIDLLIGQDLSKIQHNAQELDKALKNLEKQGNGLTFKNQNYEAPVEMHM